MELKEILEKLNIEYIQREFKDDCNELVYYCISNLSEEDIKIPILIIEDIENKLMVIKSFPIIIDIKRKVEVLEILNDFNSISLYGSAYLREKDVSYDTFIAISKNRKYKYKIIKTYIEEYIKSLIVILNKLSEHELIIEDEEN